MYHKRLWPEIVTPMGKSPNDSIKLVVITAVVEFGDTQLFTKVSQNRLVWVTTAPMSVPLALHSASKRILKLRKPR